MTTRKPLPCIHCGRPVRELGAIRWQGSGRADGFLTDLHPICRECMADPEVRALLEPRGEEVAH